MCTDRRRKDICVNLWSRCNRKFNKAGGARGANGPLAQKKEHRFRYSTMIRSGTISNALKESGS